MHGQKAVSGDEEKETAFWTACVINCGGRCPLRAFVPGGKIVRIETDNTIRDADGTRPRQIHACLKGRAMRERIESPDRLLWPMRRTGERGEGRFGRISWEEAVETVAEKLRHTIRTCGNASVFWQYCTGQQSAVNGRHAWRRLLNLAGGFLRYYGSCASAQISAAFPMTFGKKAASAISEIAHAGLYVAFGSNPSVTHGSGGSVSYQLAPVLRQSRVRTVIVDPILTDTAAGLADQWIPIRPGTDAAR